MELIKKIDNYIKQHNLIRRGDRIIVGLSGGPDSIFLLHVLHNLKTTYNLQVVAAHLDHQWRSESASDAVFCAQVAEKLNMPYETAQASELPSFKYNGSKEELGRIARRYFLQSVKEQHNAQSIALAHHAQDQQETFFIRLIRGATLTGLCAMKARDKDYVRPLLEVNKEEIIMWLDNHNVSYLIDPTNNSPSFLRNRIRMNVLPALQQVDERFNQNFLRTLDNLQETEHFLAQLTQITLHRISHIQENEMMLNYHQLQAFPELMQDRLLIQWLVNEQLPFTPTQKFLDEIKRFLFKGTVKEHTIHHLWKIVKVKDHTWLERTT